jgi:hypothetical protein
VAIAASCQKPAYDTILTMNTTQKPSHVDVLQMLRDAQGEAAAVTAAQAHLRGMVDEAGALGLFDSNPILRELQLKLDEVRKLADLVVSSGAALALPAPYGLIVQQAAHWIDVADDAFKALK